MNTDKPNEDDHELNNLLDDALNDFAEFKSDQSNATSSCKKAKSETINYETRTDFNLDLEKLNQELDHVINDNPQLKLSMKNLKEACEKQAGAVGGYGFGSSSNEFTENGEMPAELLTDDDLFNAEFAEICKGIGQQTEDNRDILSLFTNMMQNLLSKEIFYPSIKELSSKYPAWLVKNREKLENSDVDRYLKQLELMKHICLEYENEGQSDSERFQKIFSLVKEMKNYGSPPKELIGQMTDFDYPNIDLESLAMFKNDKSCSLM